MGVISVVCGGCWLGPTTTRLAEAVAPFPASVEVTAVVMLFCLPEVVPVTLSEKVHEALAAKVEADKTTLFDPALAVIVPPPQFPVRSFGVDTSCPAGKVSLKPIPLREIPEFGFAKWNVSDVLLFIATLAVPYVLVIVGANLAGGGGVELG